MKVYCKDCKWLVLVEQEKWPAEYRCSHSSNVTEKHYSEWLSPHLTQKYYKEHPSDKNNKNNCKYYESRFSAERHDCYTLTSTYDCYD